METTNTDIINGALIGMIAALGAGAHFTLSSWLATIVDTTVSEPYMDEIFHVPQAQLYCNNTFDKYHPKLTTPPGLYLSSLAKKHIESHFASYLNFAVDKACSLASLRHINIIFAMLNFSTIFVIMRLQSSALLCAERLLTLLLSSVALSLLPPLYFFTFMYYTDQGSLFFVLLTYLLSLLKHHSLASLTGLASLFYRQTNIVWVFYIAGKVALSSLAESCHSEVETTGRQKLNRQQRTLTMSDLRNIRNLNWLAFTKNCSGYAIVGLSFVAFLAWNKGIVLGDKDAHQARIHILQLLYFFGFTATFGWPWIASLNNLKIFLYYCLRKPLPVLIIAISMVYVITNYRYAHPYLLADNRHLTFYVWRRVLDRHSSLVPYLLIPIYLLAGFSAWLTLHRYHGILYALLYLVCTCAAVIPNGLLEMRYFIVPYIMLRLEARASLKTSALELITCGIINIYVLHLFLTKTFQWPDMPGLQRIMW